MARVTFVYPDFENIGVEYLMSVCMREGHEVSFIYYDAEDTYISLKRNVSAHAMAARIAETRPQVVAFSCVTDNYQAQLLCAIKTKELVPDALMIFGGIHVTAVPHLVLREPVVDAIAIGEAEKSLPAFLKECSFGQKAVLPASPIRGIAFKSNGAVAGDLSEGEFADLDSLPFPHKRPFYDSLKAFTYEYSIMTSRGCPYRCSYCFNSYMFRMRGKAVIRQRSVDNVIAELTWAKKEFAPKRVVFIDDSFTTNDAWVLQFCEKYKKEINLPFACITIPQYLSRKKAEALRSSGCVHIQIGVQSLNKEICRNVLDRYSNNEKTAEVINTLRSLGIVVHVDHMMGIPDDTVANQEESILFYNENRPSIISVFWLTYYPSTPIIDVSVEKGLLSAEDVAGINEGLAQAKGLLHSGGSMKNPAPFYGVTFLLHYIPLLPKFLVRLAVRHKLYRLVATKSYLWSTAFPRLILSIINRNDFRDRSVLVRFIYKFFNIFKGRS